MSDLKNFEVTSVIKEAMTRQKISKKKLCQHM